MKSIINIICLLFVFTLLGCGNRSLPHHNFKDSIIIFFSPFFSSHGYSPKELTMKSKRNRINDTVFMSHENFISVKNYIQNQRLLTTTVKGVPEMLVQSGKNSIYLVRFNKDYAVDADGNALIPDRKIIQLISDSIKIYNYFHEDEILLGNMYEKVPHDYKYYRKHGDKRFLNDSGVKIWIVDK